MAQAQVAITQALDHLTDTSASTSSTPRSTAMYTAMTSVQTTPQYPAATVQRFRSTVASRRVDQGDADMVDQDDARVRAMARNAAIVTCSLTGSWGSGHDDSFTPTVRVAGST